MAWEIDPAHSQVVFSVRHMVISTVRGHFDVIRGTLHIDEANPENSWVDAEADTTSINTRDTNRDNHLRSADFFDVQQYPTIHFKSTKVERVEGHSYKVTGDLTMHGVTKPVTFDAEYAGEAIKDPYGLQRTGLNGRTKISRKEWGLTWHPTLETGGAVVSDEVKIEFELEAVNRPAVTSEAEKVS